MIVKLSALLIYGICNNCNFQLPNTFNRNFLQIGQTQLLFPLEKVMAHNEIMSNTALDMLHKPTDTTVCNCPDKKKPCLSKTEAI